MRVVFLVPRRRDGGHRDRLWAYCRKRWERYFPEWPIYEGHHEPAEGPFNRSAASNRAARAADVDGRWDIGIVIDSDVMLSVSQVRAAVERAASTGKVTWAHRRWRGIREDWAIRLVADRRDLGAELDRDEMDLMVERTNPISWSCCIAFPRAVWDDIGGFDERFLGWGYEDMALQSLIVGLYGHERIEGDVIHLWHPRSEERIVQGQPAHTSSPEYRNNARLGRRYMVAARRLGFHDRHTESDAVEMQRDIANLLRDDEKVAKLQTAEERKPWDGWWPTLEELRDGAKAASRSVTLIVHTGGDEANWPERSSYLRRSLHSLSEQITGPIVQRVIYSDWGAGHRDELAAIGKPLGFYVVGPDTHLGYTASMRMMWRYIGQRARGVYVMRVEDDFEYTRPVDLGPLIDALEANPNLAQMALLRAPAYQSEIDKGGILGWPEAKFERHGGNGTSYLAHRNFWTNNPAIFRRSLVAVPWPTGPSSERLFGDALTRDPAVRFGLWGDGEAWITHLGEVRAGSVY